MCIQITPNYGCGHKDTPWLLYCNPTRKIFGRKQPPLEVCSGKDIRQQEWNVFEPRCTKCEKRHKFTLTSEGRRRTSSTTTTSSHGSSFGLRRRTSTLLEGIREAFRREHSFGSSSLSKSRSRTTMVAGESASESSGSDKGDVSDVDSLQMLELRQTLTAVDGIEMGGAIGVEPRVARGFAGMRSSSSLDSLPCSPRTTAAPTADDYFS